ncbi:MULTISPECIES: outer membrane protein [Rhizobium]|uniref:outer membrane protein n=1 Tax=Rhizobium lusitanum TaxID=293958 RepID=UPI001FEEDAC5|nr:outer membrane beta-barrel protein [Rhizobium sp. RCAM05973]
MQGVPAKSFPGPAVMSVYTAAEAGSRVISAFPAPVRRIISTVASSGALLATTISSTTMSYSVSTDIGRNWNSNSYDVLGTKVKVGTDITGAVRGRLGYAFDRTLIYATGGWTATRGFIKIPGDKESKTFNGWTIGAGVDYAFTNNIFARRIPLQQLLRQGRARHQGRLRPARRRRRHRREVLRFSFLAV